ncbi:preprotein translocase subunit YajC [Olsenella massiliensis]|uniref:preprotein translocase subunit YajC n=1 Tax=Olsenella massiliensis TaxID=1622075 RepID=UPI00071CD8D7|nr:preprotein translocase subunit YajC [Olsenella massiliensis]
MGEGFVSNMLASSVALLILFAGIGIVLMVVSLVRARSQKNAYAEVHKNLKAGQRILFAGGIFGELVRVGTKTCDVRVKSGEVLEISRFAIQQIEK